MGHDRDAGRTSRASSLAAYCLAYAWAPAVLFLLAACSNGSSVLPNLGGGPSGVDRTFMLAAGNWDRNKDGIVTCDEWKAYAAELFETGDAERKGHMTRDEWGRLLKIDRMFEIVDFSYYDRNGDQKVDRAEFIERPNRAFELADRDKNCQLTAVELTAARTAGAIGNEPLVKPAPDPSQTPGRTR